MTSPFAGPQWSWRPLLPEDLPALVSCVDQVYGSSSHPIGGGWSEEQLALELQQNKSLAVFYKPFGLTCFVLWQELPGAHEVRLLGTHPKWQRRGLMARLLRSVIEQIPPGCEFWLEVHAGNVGARNLYEKLGFSEAGRRPRYYRDGAYAILFSLQVPTPPRNH